MIPDYRTVRMTERTTGGFINIQPDRYGAQAGGPAYPAILPYGLFGRPRNPEPSSDDAATGGGLGCEAVVFTDGSEGFAMASTDARLMPLLPDTGQGGAGICALLDDGSTKGAAYMFFAGGGIAPVVAGSFTLHVPLGSKTYLLEVDLANERIRITHGDGLYIEVTPSKVTLGGAGGHPVVTDQGLTAFLSAVSTALSALGKPVGPAPTLAATKVEAL